MIKFSKMSGKLEGLRAINTNTLTNEFCIEQHKRKDPNVICTVCYSFKMLESYRKNCAPAWQHNSDVLSGGLIPVSAMPWVPDAFIRIDGHGELINGIHLENLYRFAERNPHTTVALWTKRVTLIRQGREKPANVILIYSNPRTDKIVERPPRGFDKVFNGTAEPDEQENCTGQRCIDCMACYHLDNGIETIVERVKL